MMSAGNVSSAFPAQNMSLDGKIALNDVTFNKSDFNRIPVVAFRIAVGGRQPREKLDGKRPSRAKVPVQKRKTGKAK
jgi:hypothetical protein